MRAFVEALSGKEYYADLESTLEAHKRQSIRNVIDLATGWKIDLIIRKSRAFSQEQFRRRQRVSLHDVPCLPRAPRTSSSRNSNGRNSLSRGARLRMRRQSYECNATYSTTLIWKVDPRVRSQKAVGEARRVAGIAE